MCSTCDFTKYEKVTINNTEKLQKHLGYGSLVIRCNMKGGPDSYTIAVDGEEKSDVRIYRCPTLW